MQKLVFFEVSKTTTKASIIDGLLKEAGKKRKRQHFYVAYYLCSEGKNANGLVFTPEAIEAGYKSIENTPVNWEHFRDQKFGVNIHAKLEEVRGKKYIVTLAEFYEKDNDYYNFKVRQRHEGGTLRFSMECNVKTYECEKCQAVYDTESPFYDVCECFSKGRVAKEFDFVGSAVVENPADKKAKSIEAGHQENIQKEKEMDELKKLQEEKASLENELNTAKENISKQETEIAELKTKIEESEAKIAEAEKQKEEIASEKETITKEKDELAAKVDEFEKAEILRNRQEKLKGMEVPKELEEEKAEAMEGDEVAFEKFVKIVTLFNKKKVTKNVPDGAEKSSEDKKEDKKVEDTKEEVKSVKDLF